MNANARRTSAPKPANRGVSAAKADKENHTPGNDVPAAPGSDAFNEAFERKYNIDGLNTVDIVYARQENDANRARMAKQDAKLQAQERELAALRARLGPGDADADGAAPDEEDQDLEQERAKNAELQQRIEELTKTRTDNPEKIPRPAGSAGNDFNIQNEMHLGGSRANRDIYKSLMRYIREIAIQTGINWELPWSQVPAAAKAQLFDVCRARHPILEDYVNDWATEEIVKQFFKNRRRRGYQNGTLDVPDQYKYLKANSAKRDPSGSRKRRTVVAGAPKKAAATRKKVAVAPRKVASASKTAVKTSAAKKSASVQKKKDAVKPKPKKPRSTKVVPVSDDDDDSMGEGGSASDEEEWCEKQPELCNANEQIIGYR
ncbi:hypothetical protein B0H19DRAFT_1074359 [Mycena capillaripes]|nr:hypothetical protein B0H19DRAFT_1074359 [Mycena capillaripes]